MVPRIFCKKPLKARYRNLILLPCRFFFARNQTSLLDAKGLLLERNNVFYYRFSVPIQPIHKSLLQNLRNLILPRFNIPKHSFQTIHTSSNVLKPAASYTISDLPQDTYHRLSEITMEHLFEYFESINERADIDGYDVEYSSGVLTLKCGTSGTYVLNKQPPNKQIWLSSPISGPKRYDYDSTHQKWFYHRDNSTLDELLNEELFTIFGIKVDVTLPIS